MMIAFRGERARTPGYRRRMRSDDHAADDLRGPARVAVLGHTATMSGAEVALLRMLRQVDPDRASVVVITFADGPLVDRVRALGLEARVLLLDPTIATADRSALAGSLGSARTAIAFTRRLARLLREIDADVVHCNTLKADVLGGSAARLAHRPAVWYVHDRLSDDYLPRPVSILMRCAAHLLPRLVIANSRATLDTIGVAPTRSTVVHPGLDPDSFAASLPTPPHPPVVGMIGRISPTKGQNVFLRAATAVLASHPDARFVVAGAALFNEQAYEREVRDLAQRLGISDRVRFVGQVPDVPGLMSGLSVFVHASPVPEPFGQVIVEAMAVGVPVVATAAGGVPEITGADGELALTVPPGDADALAAAIISVLDRPDDARQRAARAQHSVRQRFSAVDTAEAVTGVWERARRLRRRRAGR